jgi:hypothetical protein
MSNLLVVTNSNFSQMAILQIDPDQRAISAMPLGIAAVSENVGTQVPFSAHSSPTLDAVSKCASENVTGQGAYLTSRIKLQLFRVCHSLVPMHVER